MAKTRSSTERISIIRQAYELARETLAESYEIDAMLDWKLAAAVAWVYLAALDAGEVPREDVVDFVARRSLGRLRALLGPPRQL